MKKFETNPQIEYLQQRLAELQRRTAEGPDKCDELMSDVLEELFTTLEELQVADEELRQQNEELAAANQAVETERQRYLDLFDLAPDGYIVTDAKGIIREANRSAAAMLNVSQEFLMGKPFFLYLAEGERKNWHPQLAQLAQKDRVENWQAVVQPREGDLFYASVTVARVRDRDGKPTGLRFLIRDITERKKLAEELEKYRHHLEDLVKQRTGELRDSNELLERVFSNTHVLIAYMDTDFNFIRVNDAYAAADEHKPNYFVGKNHFSLYPNKENESIFRRVVETGEPYSVYAKPFEYAERPERGVTHWDWSLIPIKDAREKVEGVLLCLVNVTDRVLAEEELRKINETLEQRVLEREGQFQLLFSRMNEGFALHEIICDENGEPCDYRFLEINPAFERLTGLKRSTLMGKTVREVLPDIESFWIETYGKVALTGEPVRFEHYSFPLKRNYEVFAFCPALGQFAALFTDISERKKVEQAILRAKEEWETTFDTVPDLIIILDSNHRVVRANKAMADRLGVTPDQCVGLRCYEVVHGQDHPPDFCPHTLTCEDGKEHQAEVHEPRLGGDFLVTTTPLRDGEGKLIGSVHVARDITARKQFEEALRKSDEDLNRAQAVAHTGSWRLDVQKNELLWSDENHRIFGIPKGTPMTYETFLGAVHPDDREYVDTKWTAALRGEPYDIEHRIVVSDTVKWVRERAELEFDNNSTLLGGFGTTQDITARKQAEERVRESRERLRTALDASGGAIYDHRVPLDESTYHDERWAELLGYDRNELPPHDRFLDWLYERVHPEDLDLLKRTYEDFIEGRSPGYHVEVRLRHKQGHWFWVEGYSHGVERDESGRVRRVVGVMTDITERKQAEEKVRGALEKSERHSAETEALLESSRAVLEHQHFKDAAQAIFESCRNQIGATAGYVALLSRDGTQNELVFLESGGLSCSVDPDLPMPIRGLRAEAYRSGIPVYDNDFADSEWTKFLPAGHVRLENVMFAPLILGESAVGLMGLANKPGGFTDDDARLAAAFADHASIALRNSLYLEAVRSSEAKYRNLSESLEEAVEEKVEELKQAQRLAAIGQMVSVVAHEIRNPLQNIRMGIDAVRKAAGGDKDTVETLEDVDYGINLLNRIVEELLEYSRPVKLHCSMWPIRDLVEQALHSLSHRLHNTNVHMELEGEDGEIFIDAPKMIRALVNVVSNAVEAMPDGGDLWICSRFSESDGAPLLNLSISDSGCGIDAEGLERIKEPFFTTKTSGTGLGVHICKKIVEAHGGSFSIQSTVNQGTTVEFSLPVENA